MQTAATPVALLPLEAPFPAVTDEDMVDKLKMAVAYLARTNETAMERSFPGTQPVSFTRADLARIGRDFVVCEKTDGVRYLLLAWNFKMYLISRKFQFFPLPIQFPQARENFEDSVQGTLLDGELVHEGQTNTVFYVFDAICVRKRYVGHLRLTDRLRVAASDFVGVIPRLPTNPLLLLLKKMFAARDALYVYKELVPRLLHGNDGLVFTKDNAVYKIGTCEDVIKWKPAHLNSVDFSLGVLEALGATGKPEARYGKMFWANRLSLEPYDLLMWLNEEERETLAGFLPSAIVVECVWDPDWFTMTSPGQGQDARWAKALPVHGGGWRLMRVRTDKEGPNDKATVKKVWQSILDQVGEEELALALRV